MVCCPEVSTVASTSGAPPPPVTPRGITKSNTASFSSPELVTSAWVPGSPVITVPMLIVAAAPVGPVSPVAPVSPIGPVAPVSPVSPVAPVAPVTPAAPVSPFIPCGPSLPCGITNSKTAS